MQKSRVNCCKEVFRKLNQGCSYSLMVTKLEYIGKNSKLNSDRYCLEMSKGVQTDKIFVFEAPTSWVEKVLRKTGWRVCKIVSTTKTKNNTTSPCVSLYRFQNLFQQPSYTRDSPSIFYENLSISYKQFYGNNYFRSCIAILHVLEYLFLIFRKRTRM